MYTGLVAYTIILEDNPNIDSDLNDDNSNGDEAMDEEDAPDWEFDVDEKCLLDPMYEFCPATHVNSSSSWSLTIFVATHSSPLIMALTRY